MKKGDIKFRLIAKSKSFVCIGNLPVEGAQLVKKKLNPIIDKRLIDEKKIPN